jgi:DNA-binding PadR family transcriptional regulator
MTDENLKDAHEKFIKHFTNAIIHKLILWIISKQTIHGYGIMKKLDEFFSFEDSECDIKINSSKVYPILSKMEDEGLIEGEWKINENNKRVKYYSITEDGKQALSNIKNNMDKILSNPSWFTFLSDITGWKINNECNRNS